MLEIVVPISPEGWDEVKQEFVEPKTQVLKLEHSLVSLSKWESKWCKPYLTQDIKTQEESIDYVRCMTITQNVDPEVYNHLTNENIATIDEYVNAKRTATWFAEEPGSKGSRSNGEQVTSELIYYWMISLNIPFKCEKWHLNRLLTLIRVCDVKSKPPKKMSMRERLARQAALNAKRKQQFNTKG